MQKAELLFECSQPLLDRIYRGRGLALLRERGDAKMRPDLPVQDIRDWFGDRLPDTLAAENAYLAMLDPAAAKAERARFWPGVSLKSPKFTPAVAVASHLPVVPMN